MNTTRILDIMPTSAVSNAPVGHAAAAELRGRPAVPELKAGSPEGQNVPDAARRKVDTERAKQREDSTRRESAAPREPAERNFSSRVGFFDGSSMVFVDLVDPKTQRVLMRFFGPSREPTPGDPRREASSASQAYEEAMRRAEAGRRTTRN
jgi:hypothetical protein